MATRVERTPGVRLSMIVAVVSGSGTSATTALDAVGTLVHARVVAVVRGDDADADAALGGDCRLKLADGGLARMAALLR